MKLHGVLSVNFHDYQFWSYQLLEDESKDFVLRGSWHNLSQIEFQDLDSISSE